jgi:hypothetical protein
MEQTAKATKSRKDSNPKNAIYSMLGAFFKKPTNQKPKGKK